MGWPRSSVNRGPSQALRRPEEGRRRLENEWEYPLQVAGNFHFAPGKSFQQSHVHGECTCLRWGVLDPGCPGGFECPCACPMLCVLGPGETLITGQQFGTQFRAQFRLGTQTAWVQSSVSDLTGCAKLGGSSFTFLSSFPIL